MPIKLWAPEQLPPLPDLKVAVVGHVEWVQFLDVDRLPQPGLIAHALQALEEPAGGGAVVAVQLARLLARPVRFFTALGADAVGRASVQRLQQLGLQMEVAWRDAPSRRGISMVDEQADRSITVVGERLTPGAADPLPWHELAECDAVFVTAADPAALRACRAARILAATPRVRLPVLEQAQVRLDALIGSGLDPGEQVPDGSLSLPPLLRIATAGAEGGWADPGGPYAAAALEAPMRDSYGCGDSFAAGVVAGLAAAWPLDQAISLGCHCGARCASRFGPYEQD